MKHHFVTVLRNPQPPTRAVESQVTDSPKPQQAERSWDPAGLQLSEERPKEEGRERGESREGVGLFPWKFIQSRVYPNIVSSAAAPGTEKVRTEKTRHINMELP